MSYTPIKSRILRFNGTTNYLDAPDSSSLSFGTGGGGTDTPFTIGVWAKIQSGSGVRCPLLSKGNEGAANSVEWRFGYNNTAGYLVFEIDTNDANYIEMQHQVNTVPNVRGMPCFFGAHYDGSKTTGGIVMQLNATTLSLTSVVAGAYSGLNSTNTTMQVARRANGSFYGKVDIRHICIWINKTSAWLSTLYNSGSIPDSTQLSEYATKCVALYDFNNTLSINDLTSNANNLSYQGGLSASGFLAPNLDF